MNLPKVYGAENWSSLLPILNWKMFPHITQLPGGLDISCLEYLRFVLFCFKVSIIYHSFIYKQFAKKCCKPYTPFNIWQKQVNIPTLLAVSLDNKPFVLTRHESYHPKPKARLLYTNFSSNCVDFSSSLICSIPGFWNMGSFQVEDIQKSWKIGQLFLFKAKTRIQNNSNDNYKTIKIEATQSTQMR